MTESEAIEVLTDRHTSIGTTKCDDVAWRKLKPAIDIAVNALEEIQQYRAIGTVEEYRKARERQRAKKPFKALEHQKKSGYKHKCPKCGCAVGYVEKTPFRKRVLIEHAAPYCCVCGQKLNWSE